MFHSRRVILPREFSEIWHLVPIWKWDQIVCRGIWCPIRISINLRFYSELISHSFDYFISPIGIGILPMWGLKFWHLLISLHVSLRCTISREHGIDHRLLATNLLSKIHRLIGWSLILKTNLHLSLLESRSLMILLCHLLKDKLPCLTIVGIHQRRPCRLLIIGCHHWLTYPI